MLHFVNCIFHFPNDVAAVIVIDNILHAAKKKNSENPSCNAICMKYRSKYSVHNVIMQEQARELTFHFQHTVTNAQVDSLFLWWALDNCANPLAWNWQNCLRWNNNSLCAYKYNLNKVETLGKAIYACVWLSLLSFSTTPHPAASNASPYCSEFYWNITMSGGRVWGRWRFDFHVGCFKQS